MNSSDALEVFREEMNDEATPYLWSDSLVFRYLDQAQKNFCRWTEGIEDSTTTAITQATVTAGVDWVELDKRVLKVREVVNVSTGRPYKVHNMEDAARLGVVFNGRVGQIEAFVTGLSKHMLRAWPLPTEDTDIELRVFRLPLVDITDAGDEEFEIDEQHHMALLLWAKAMAYGKEDAETFNKSKRDDYEVRFRSYCAEAKKEQGRMRRDVGVVAYGGL